ncbi:VanZ family protein [Thermoanaerobacterium sp. DL9XJH110]|uniref:VanZ family protein n=1 Tax=Thermoanaerobacterium sp. DL9XJH110 TaxID=3386643 RepID=UPI003BB7445D
MKIRWFKWLTVIIWCIIIFWFTASPMATGDNTAKIIAENTSLPYNGVEMVNVIIRKYAHLMVFGILALLFRRAINPARHAYFLAWGFTRLYALSDEWHQAFVPGRSASIRDVILDSAGALMFLAIHYFRKQTAKTSNG